MGMLYLVRHGQASFGQADYDRLSPLGHQQAQRLGQYLRARWAGSERVPQAVLMGTLRRHRETWEGIAQGAGWDHTPQILPALDEYDSHALIEALGVPPDLPPLGSPEGYRAHFRLLRQAIQAWMDARTAPRGMPSYADFVAGLDAVLQQVSASGHPSVLLVSSGGPISTLVGRVLQTPPASTIEMNLRIRNTAVSELEFNARRHALISYNHLPHLDDPTLADWITYA